MKKKWALLLVAALALQPLSALTVNAEATEPDVYADVYGIEVDFGATPEAADYADLTLLKGENEEVVPVTWADDGSTSKKIINVSLDTDTKYKLSFGITEKEFKVKTIFFEDFDDASVFATQDISDTTPFETTNSYGDIEVSYGTKGAFIKDGKIWVTDGALTITNLDTFDDLTNTTLMADVEGYAKYYKQGTNWKCLPGSVSLRMISRAQDANIGASGVQLNQENFELVSVQDGGVVAEIANTLTTYPNSENYDFGKIATLSGSDRTLIVTKDTDITGTGSAVSDERAIALRTNKKSIAAFADTATTTYSDESVSDVAGDYVLGLTYSGRGIAVFDNVRITAYTEDTEEITGDLEPLSLENDNYEKLVLTFNKRLRDLTPSAFETLQVLKDGTDITSETTITLDPADDTKLNIVPDVFNAGYIYSIVVPEGFGKGSLLTTQEYTPSVNVEATPITVQSFDFKPEGIEITFDTDLTDITDQSDLDAVSVQIGDANCENFVADTGATVTKDGAKLMVVPSTYIVNSSYKVVIPQGFGDAVTYLTSEYTHTQLFERIPVEVEEIYGNDGRIDIKFTSPINKNDSTLNLDNIEIREITKDAATGNDITSTTEETITSSITDDGELHIEFTGAGMTLDKIYEVYVPKSVGTDTVGLAHDIRRKFTLTTIAFENFENDGQSVGGIATGLIKSPDSVINGNDTCGYVYGKYYNLISNNEISQTENYTMEFDYGIYYGVNYKNSAYINVYDIEANNLYRSVQSLLFNKQGSPQTAWNSNEENYVRLTLKEHMSEMNQRYREDGSGLNTSSIRYSSYAYTGDAVKKSDGTFQIYNYGEEFIGIETGKEFKTYSGQIVSASQRTPSKARKIKIVKTGSHFKVYRENDDGTMQVLHDYQPNKMTKKKGHIEVGGDGVEILSFDNIRFNVVKFIEEDVIASDLVVTTGGNISEQSTLEGTFKIKNFADEQKDVRAIVVAYNANGSMLCADLDAATYISGCEELNLDFDLINATGTTSIKLFLWNNTTNRKQFGVYDFPVTP